MPGSLPGNADGPGTGRREAVIRLGITGTDTGIGKTVVAAALTALARDTGLDVAAMKPVETGVERGDPASDAVLLREAAGGEAPPELVCPIVLPEPLAPSVAARRAEREVSLAHLDDAFRELSRGKELVVVEGAGGILVPLTAETAFDSLFHRWSLDVVIVAGNRLGVLNQTLLTVEAARRAGLRIRGVVLNALAPQARSIAEETNLFTLEELLPEIPILAFPWVKAWDDGLRNPSSLAEVARRFDLHDLLRDPAES